MENRCEKEKFISYTPCEKCYFFAKNGFETEFEKKRNKAHVFYCY